MSETYAKEQTNENTETQQYQILIHRHNMHEYCNELGEV